MRNIYIVHADAWSFVYYYPKAAIDRWIRDLNTPAYTHVWLETLARKK